jgi:hypothetical protein
VESFPSYIHRVAFEHGVYVGELLRYLYKHGANEGLISEKTVLPQYSKPSELSRPSKTTLMLRDLFQYYSNQNLNNSVLWMLENSLGKSNDEIVHGFRWCPECLSETLSHGGEPYFKLIWHLTAIKACPIHRTPLVGQCDFCGCTQTSYRKRRSIGCCQDCGKTLSKRNKRLKPKDVSNSWEDIGLDIIALFSDLAAVEPGSFPEGGAQKSVEDLFNYYWRTCREDEFYQSITRDEVLAIVFKQSAISLKSARRIAYRLGLSLFELLSGDASQTTDVLDHEQFCSLPPGYLEANAKTRRDHRKVINKIKRLIKASKEPPSLKEVARRSEVSVGYLEYRFPVLVKDIVRSHQDFVQYQRLRSLHKAQSKALEFFVSEKYQKYPQSRKQAYRTLREETGLPKFMLRKAIQNAYEVVFS